ncbi:MAG: ribonuclease HII [Verrucomicrobiota bacterium]|nr:ribonuclease HII [Verrucomicrobiota bacterium]
MKFEKALRDRGFLQIAGIDEAGRGPLAGPVVASAVILPHDFKHKILNDSKQLSADEREALFHEITTNPNIIWAKGVANHQEVDRFNILGATYLAMKRAVDGLSTQPDHLLIDGLPVKIFTIPQQAIVEGDAKSFSIAAASVIAKVTRDRIMCQLHQIYPQYNFAKHKGYGTAEHYQSINKYGICPIHRKSFQPIREAEELALDYQTVG